MMWLLGLKRDKAHLSRSSRLRLKAALLKAKSRGFTRSKHQVLHTEFLAGAVLVRRRPYILVSSPLTRFASVPVESFFPILSTVVKRVRAMFWHAHRFQVWTFTNSKIEMIQGTLCIAPKMDTATVTCTKRKVAKSVINAPCLFRGTSPPISQSHICSLVTWF